MGNIASHSITFIIDTIAPEITINNPLSSISNQVSQVFNITATDANEIDAIWYNWEGINHTYTAPFSINISEGDWTLNAWARDSAGHIATVSVDFTIDIIPPQSK